MGNFMCLRRKEDIVMVATRFGIRHVTVVPTNFEASEESIDPVEDVDDTSTETVN